MAVADGPQSSILAAYTWLKQVDIFFSRISRLPYPSRGIEMDACPRLLRKTASLYAIWSRRVLVVSYKTVWLIDGVLSTIGNSMGTPRTITVWALFQIVSGQYSGLSSLYSRQRDTGANPIRSAPSLRASLTIFCFTTGVLIELRPQLTARHLALLTVAPEHVGGPRSTSVIGGWVN